MPIAASSPGEPPNAAGASAAALDSIGGLETAVREAAQLTALLARVSERKKQSEAEAIE